jgi:hypothetical protein
MTDVTIVDKRSAGTRPVEITRTESSGTEQIKVQIRGGVADLGPFHNRPAEWELYQPLVGNSMLELGGKINAPYTYKAYFERLGFRHISIDWNGDHGAQRLDLRKPLGLGTFDMVTNIGTTEHVNGQAEVWRNVLEAMHVGSVLVSTTPMPGDWTWHGIWQVDSEWYEELCRLNGLRIDRLYQTGESPRRMIFLRAWRESVAEFVMPKRLIHHNPGGR